jgi:hypothetical protein
MDIGAADGRFHNLDPDIIGTEIRHRCFLHPNTDFGFAFGEDFHGFHGDLLRQKTEWPYRRGNAISVEQVRCGSSCMLENDTAFGVQLKFDGNGPMFYGKNVTNPHQNHILANYSPIINRKTPAVGPKPHFIRHKSWANFKPLQNTPV